MNGSGFLSGAYKSQFCKIRAGSSEEAFYAHADVLKRSEVLRVQVAGSWKDIAGKDGIDWTSWNVNTVERFLDWLYTGDYRCAYPTEIRGSGEFARDKTVDEACGGDLSGPSERRNDLAVAMTKDQLSQAEEFDKWTGHRLWASHQLDYEATFATHSELYVMACQYMLPELKNMAWQRLRSVLLTIGAPRPGSHVIKDLVGLITFVYKESAGDYNTVEPMRELLTKFVALNLTNLRGSDEFGVLLSSNDPDDRDFVADLMAKVMQKMEDLEGKTSKRQGGAPIVMPEAKRYDYPSTWEGMDSWSPDGKKGRGKCSKCGKRGDALYDVPSEPSLPD